MAVKSLVISMGLYSKVQCEAPKVAKLVQITAITMVYGIYNYSILGLINQLIAGGPHIVGKELISMESEVVSRVIHGVSW